MASSASRDPEPSTSHPEASDNADASTAVGQSWEDRILQEERHAQEVRAAKVQKEEEERQARMRKFKNRSSWNAVEAGGGRGEGADYLYELGASSFTNLNIDTGQNASMVESHIAGNFLGAKSDLADGTLRRYEFRNFSNLVGDYWVSPRFLDRLSLFMAKNYMVEMGCIPSSMGVPLILGIWGPKGMGKSFQTELALKKLGAEAVVMSAGELEHEWAGTPGRLIRSRYKMAGDLSKVRGKFSALLINDIDAGLGHFANTQTTVNNQNVIGTLMNICDHPNQVSLGEEWMGESNKVRRTPIIVTGNDFSKMFAPLIRDGRMDKFYWRPDHDDLVSILAALYADDGLSPDDVSALLKRFPEQPLDFFGALRASVYDNQIRSWIEKDVIGGVITHDNCNLTALSQRLLKKKELPIFTEVELSLQGLMQEGLRLEKEQQNVKDHHLSQDYFKKTGNGGSLIGLKG
eukprot:CAMPEP_0119103428 /NCGR_PEP_ID=MMETSP1180-20130426/1857_1 /TAXON_ID=3052 ORGANISM="Chlamydomonas cf sp, Strain CCMP681" /NCGR_SAMPLE_ID=MMETSP1180 /ASSEMBLY_ACC=CAM_ASM_000741 /LENGTH=461 /DNA_ID=CAMNT_0007087915 /DNA_START=56 /DNA_END=1442 /DNA_ORIENTATION=-